MPGAKRYKANSHQMVVVIIISTLILFVSFPARSNTLDDSWSLRDVVRTLEPSVVWVMADVGNDDWTQGSGFIVSENGLIITAAHIIDGADEVIIGWPDRYHLTEKTAEILAIDINLDLALLKIDAVHLPAMNIDTSTDAALGDAVIAMGYPVGDELGLGDLTVTRGILSSIRSFSPENNVELLQTDAAVTLGCSGGPLFDLDTGCVIGIIQGKGMMLLEGFNFAIPSDKLIEFAGLGADGQVGDAILALSEDWDPGISLPSERSLEIWELADNARVLNYWGEALGNFMAAERLHGEDPLTAYGIAESYAALHRPTHSLHWLERAFGLGFTDFEGALASEGFSGFQDDNRFVELVQSFR